MSKKQNRYDYPNVGVWDEVGAVDRFVLLDTLS